MKQYMKWGYFGIALVMFVLLAACATLPPPPPAPPAPAATQPPAAPAATSPAPAEAASIKVWYITGSPAEIQTLQDLTAKFMQKNPNIKVEFIPTAFDEALKTWKLAMDSDTGPDVGYIGSGGPFLVASAKAGKLLDLAPAAKEMGWDKRIVPWDNVTLYNPFNGSVYGTPYDYALVGVYYNKDIFKQLGLAVPKTWQEFESAIAAIKAKGITPFAVGGLDKWPIDHYTWTIAHTTVPYQEIYNVWQVQKDGNFNNPGWAQALEIFKGWSDNGDLNEGYTGVSMGDALNLFTTGKAAMLIGGTWNTPQIVKDAKFEAGYFPMPRVSDKLEWHAILGPNNFWVVPKASKNQQAAIAYIDYMLGEEVATAKWAQGDIPMFKFANPPAPTSPIQLDIYNAVGETGAGHYIFQNMQDVGAIYQDQTFLVLDGKTTPADAIKTIQAAYEKKLAETGQ